MEIGGRIVTLAAGLATVIIVEATKFARHAMAILLHVPRAEVTDIVQPVQTAMANVRIAVALVSRACLRSLSQRRVATRRFSFTVHPRGMCRQMLTGYVRHAHPAMVTTR